LEQDVKVILVAGQGLFGRVSDGSFDGDADAEDLTISLPDQRDRSSLSAREAGERAVPPEVVVMCAGELRHR
jgi:hypothetical protein